jgi:DNA-binding NtrC family response regulator
VAVRIVAATNKDLAKEVKEGRFRQDLYYRLRVIPIEIPPLRERREDIEPLLSAFIRHFNGEFHKSVQGIAPQALERLLAYPWPGNVRELRNAVERAVLLFDGELLTLGDLPGEILGRNATAGAAGSFELPPGGLSLEELEREMLRQALARAGGNRTRAAKLLGMNRDQIRYRIQKFGLHAPPEGGP